MHPTDLDAEINHVRRLGRDFEDLRIEVLSLALALAPTPSSSSPRRSRPSTG
ncbi:hypothetical protein ACWD4G_31865 [Streptomyces sp. NPDC002643]